MTTTASSALPAEISAQLSGLRDIHLPHAVSWWPLAPGWWVLATLVVASLIVAFIIHRKRKRSLKQAAIRELATLADRYTSDDNIQALASEVGVLIRRVALRLPDGHKYANVQGTGWIDYLASLPGGMQRSIAQYLTIAPYAEPATAAASLKQDPASSKEISRTAIISEADVWIRRHA